jgi:Domain of unknown function (DUF4326)
MLLPHPLLRHRGYGEPSNPCVSAAAHSPQTNTSEEDSVLKEKVMGQIRIVNKHQGACAGVYVGRPTLLGNPYRVQRDAREQAVQQYRAWLRRQWQVGGEVKEAFAPG